MLTNKIQNALDEARTLVLGAQVLLGFQFTGIFQNGFEKLPGEARYLQLGGLVLLLLALGMLTSPAPYHHLAAHGQNRPDFHRFTTIMTAIALLPFALALGSDIYIATEKLFDMRSGLAAGIAASGVALFFWYGLELIGRRVDADKHEREDKKKEAGDDSNEKTGADGGMELKDKVREVLTEARVVLPGAQALLGFQFTVTLTDSFDKLPSASKYIHLASLALIAMSIVLLMTPSAYHRIVEGGEDTEHFVRLASGMVLASLVPLALGLAGDLYVVTLKITGSMPSALVSAALTLTFFYGLWFGYTLLRRAKR
jgi:hypothetical protein